MEREEDSYAQLSPRDYGESDDEFDESHEKIRASRSRKSGHSRRASSDTSHHRSSRGGHDDERSHRRSSNHNRPSRSYSTHKGRPSHGSVKSSASSRAPKKYHSKDHVIALFGGYGVTGHYFQQLALEAGYKVRTLIPPGMQKDDLQCASDDNITIVTGSHNEDSKVRRVLMYSKYVVCFLQDCETSPMNFDTIGDGTSVSSSKFTGNGSKILIKSPDDDDATKASATGSVAEKAEGKQLTFIKSLYRLINEMKICEVFLYQSSSFARGATGSTPMLSTMFKKLALRKQRRDEFKEQDDIVKFIYNHPSHSADSSASISSVESEDKENTSIDDIQVSAEDYKFSFIVTRPGAIIWDRPSRKKLAASKSQPGPFPITNVDLAEFSLDALRMKKLRNTSPYVVQDGV